MKKIIILIIIGLIAVYIYGASEYAQPHEEPEWVTEIKNKINTAECDATDCEACDHTQCSAYPGACELKSRMYSCGASCDAGIAYCVSAFE
ncbi:hypothetical protein KKF55_06115 [Patescibacteria group bacterium]|nr:hypothetical protein [Patescibacteria group bacterium]